MTKSGIFFAGLLYALLAAAGDAEHDAQLRWLQASVLRIQQAQQSLVQQFAMIEELRRVLLQQATPQPPPPVSGLDGELPSYDDALRRRQQMDQQLQRYAQELEQLYARYRKLDAEKKPLLDSIVELSRPSGAGAPAER